MCTYICMHVFMCRGLGQVQIYTHGLENQYLALQSEQPPIMYSSSPATISHSAGSIGVGVMREAALISLLENVHDRKMV